MKLKQLAYRLVSMRGGVAHTTLNPYGPGVVRIYLIPPKLDLRGTSPSVAIINGQDIIPINPSWAILLHAFIGQINKYNGKEIGTEELEGVVSQTLKVVKRIYPRTSDDQMREDLWKIINTLCDVAYGKEPQENIGYMTLGEYAPQMTAPHRMDLMVSSMRRKDGRWNCNQKCLHCYAAGQEQAEVVEMPTDSWKDVIGKCRKIGIPQLTFTGGEPTIREDLVELIEHAKWFVTRLNTNGIKLTPELCKRLYEASLDSVQVTLYSSVKAEHNVLVGAVKDSICFAATIDGIQNALEAGLNVSVNTPLCKINSDYLRTLEFLHEIGVKYVSCSGLIVTGNACNENSRQTQLTEEELYDILKSATEYCAEHQMEISFTSPGWVAQEKLQELGLTVPSCGACLSNMAIAPDGSVVPCQSWLDNDSSLGNILLDSWRKIWNSERCKEIRTYSSLMACRCPLRNRGKAK